MTKAGLVLALVGLALVCALSTLVIVLLPSPPDNNNHPTYDYDVTDDGNIRWYQTDNHVEKLLIRSSILNQTNGKFETGNTGLFVASINTIESSGDHGTMCWEMTSSNLQESGVEVTDCLSMNTTNGEAVYWYGGAEMINQKWPINNIRNQRGAAFLSSDLPGRYGNVLERYYLSSRGAAVYVYEDVPLYVSMFANKEICLTAKREPAPVIGAGYLKDDKTTGLTLRYVVCIGQGPKSAHQEITHPAFGYIERPKDLPDLKMMKDPIWSTWARFKSSINQSVIEDFADEILENNFSNSQLEIDDGYEEFYGDFSFDDRKFPDAKGMIHKLNEKGFRVTTWVTPFINLDSKHYKEGRNSDYFVQENTGEPGVIRWWNGRGSIIDFTNQEAADWFQKILTNAKDTYGLDSYKFDAGEISYLPTPGLNYTAVRIPNPSEYTKLYADTAFKIGGKMMEMRASWKTQSGAFYMRIMDKGSSWEAARGFETVIPTVLTFSILGYAYVLPDMIGGNTYVFGTQNDNRPERELFIRWIELSAFLPAMQFSICPWQYDAEVTSIAHKYVDLHRDVIYKQLLAAAEIYIAGAGNPIIAPIWFESELDSKAITVGDEFLIGDKYLVAPITKKGARERDIYLPGSVAVQWKDKMRPDCVNGGSNCIVSGGTLLKSYPVKLDEISWWEKIILE